MFCLECGEFILDGSVTCPKCGTVIRKDIESISDEQAVVYASQNITNEETTPKTSFSKKLPKKVYIGIAALIGLIVVFFIGNEVNKANLKKQLVKEWYDTDGSIIKVLDIEDGKMEYRLETGYSWMDMSVDTYDWKPAGKNKIKIQRYKDEYETFTIEFNDEKTLFKISPAITSVDEYEYWYNID